MAAYKSLLALCGPAGADGPGPAGTVAQGGRGHGCLGRSERRQGNHCVFEQGRTGSCLIRVMVEVSVSCGDRPSLHKRDTFAHDSNRRLRSRGGGQSANGDDRNDMTRQIASDVAHRQIAIVNVVFVGPPSAGDGGCTFVDAGLPASAADICAAARACFGGSGRPAAIILTHGYFDHVGVLETLAEDWDVPVYAHQLDHPYLNGTSSYPPANPSVGGGLMALLSPLFPTRPVNVGSRLRALPENHASNQAESFVRSHSSQAALTDRSKPE
jgi:hypothetical protein